MGCGCWCAVLFGGPAVNSVQELQANKFIRQRCIGIPHATPQHWHCLAQGQRGAMPEATQNAAFIAWHQEPALLENQAKSHLTFKIRLPLPRFALLEGAVLVVDEATHCNPLQRKSKDPDSTLSSSAAVKKASWALSALQGPYLEPDIQESRPGAAGPKPLPSLEAGQP